MKQNIKKIILPIILSLPLVAPAKVIIYGDLPKSGELISKLVHFPKSLAGNQEYFDKTYKEQVQELITRYTNAKDSNTKLYIAHRRWLDPIYETLLQLKKDSSSDKSDLSPFSKNDAEKILKPIVKSAYDFDIDENLLGYFPEKLEYDLENKPTITQKFYKEDYCQETYKAAKKVFELSKGNMLLVVGQTPSYIGIMAEELNKTAKLEDQIDIQYIPFSGRPDLIRSFRWADNMYNYSVKDILTQEREDYFREILQSKNFSPQYFKENPTKKIFYLDNTTGTTLAQFLLISARWFKEHQMDLPDITLINMRESKKDIDELDLKVNENCYFQIDSYYLDMEEKVLEDFDKVTNNLRIQPPYPCIYWNLESENMFKLYPQPEAIKLGNFYRQYIKQSLNN